MRKGIRKYHLQYLPFIITMTFFSSCMNDEKWNDRNKPNLSVGEVMNDGVIILNEGNFMYGNASLTYYNPVTKKSVNDVFYKQNGIPLGDVAHSAGFFNGELFVVVNNSGKIITLNMGRYPSLYAFEYTHKITGFISPRYIHFFDDRKAYVTDLYARQIYIVYPAQYKIKGEININNGNVEFYQHSAEQIIVHGDFVFINCYSFDNSILVIDSKSDKVVDSIQVLAQPNSMVMDRYDKLWVLCDGGYQGSNFLNTYPGLIRIDPETRTIEKIFIFSGDDWPSDLSINGSKDTLFYLNKDIWRMPVNATNLPDLPFISASDRSGTKLFYSLGIDPINSEIYAGDAIDHVQNGTIYRFSAQAVPIDTIPAGIIPGYICFVRID